jgi:hypothetical protein
MVADTFPHRSAEESWCSRSLRVPSAEPGSCQSDHPVVQEMVTHGLVPEKPPLLFFYTIWKKLMQ